MAARQRLSEAQIAELYDPPTEQRELVRHFTLSDADLAANRRCRGDHNRLGQALMLCYLRYPGRPLRAGERPPTAMLAFVAEQIEVCPEMHRRAIWRPSETADVIPSRCRSRLRAAPVRARDAAAELTAWLLPQAIEDDRFAHLARAGDGGMPTAAGHSADAGGAWNACALSSATRRAVRCIAD